MKLYSLGGVVHVCNVDADDSYGPRKIKLHKQGWAKLVPASSMGIPRQQQKLVIYAGWAMVAVIVLFVSYRIGSLLLVLSDLLLFL